MDKEMTGVQRWKLCLFSTTTVKLSLITGLSE